MRKVLAIFVHLSKILKASSNTNLKKQKKRKKKTLKYNSGKKINDLMLCTHLKCNLKCIWFREYFQRKCFKDVKLTEF